MFFFFFQENTNYSTHDLSSVFGGQRLVARLYSFRHHSQKRIVGLGHKNTTSK